MNVVPHASNHPPASQAAPAPGVAPRGPVPAGSASGLAPEAQVDAPAEVPVNILIVDDEQKNLTVLETVLDDPGYRLVRADTVDKALMAMIAEEFALIILDVNMPEMSGFELAQMIRERRKTARVPIIFLTAYYNEDEHILEGYAAGAVDYLHKPVNRTILRSKVATFVELHRSARALQLEVAERRLAQEQLRAINETLEQRVQEKTEALRATDAQLSAMIDALPVAIYTTDAAGHLTRFNPATTALTGKTPRIGVDRWCPTHRLLRTDGTGLPHDQGPMALALKHGRIVRDMPLIAERPDGERVWIMPCATPLRDASGTIVGGINMLVDITRAKRAEEELGAAKRAAEEANVAKSDFLAHMSHEIRTPMNAIFGFTQLLSESIHTAVERDWIASIKKSGDLLLSVINDVLDLSKIEAGKLDLNPQPTDLVELLDDMIAMFAPQATAKGIGLSRSVEADTTVLQLDGHRLRQVLMNLISNAVKFTEAGEVTVQLEILPAQAVHGETGTDHDVVFTVADTGVGIPAAQVGTIFEPFCQAESPDGKHRQGTGLGLTISRRLVDAMLGEIEVASTVGEGTTFRLRLHDVPATDEAPVHAPLDEDVDFDALPPLNILVIDDVPWNLEVAQGYLRNSRHCVHTAGDATTGLALARRIHPDVVLMDLRMPGMDGYRACQAIRADASLAQTIVIAVTASSLNREEVELRKGFDGFVRKPYTPTQLFRALTQSLGPVQPRAAEEDVEDDGDPAAWNEALRARWHALQQVALPAMRSRMRMRELGEFARTLGEFAEDARYPRLRRRVDALNASIETFNVTRTREMLQSVSELPADFDPR